MNKTKILWILTLLILPIVSASGIVWNCERNNCSYNDLIPQLNTFTIDTSGATGNAQLVALSNQSLKFEDRITDKFNDLNQSLRAYVDSGIANIDLSGQGEQGPAGPQGPQGNQGIQGPAGSNGAPGADGTNGVNGSTPNITSVTWESGVFSMFWDNGYTLISPNLTGPQGPKGDTGNAGSNGVNGTSCLLTEYLNYTLNIVTDNTTTYRIIPDLTNTLNGNSTYIVRCDLMTYSAAVATGERIRVNTTNSPTKVTWSFNSQVSATTRTPLQGVNTASNAFADTGSAGTNVRDITMLQGYIVTGAGNSLITYELTTEVAASNATIDIGSYCRYTKVV